MEQEICSFPIFLKMYLTFTHLPALGSVSVCTLGYWDLQPLFTSTFLLALTRSYASLWAIAFSPVSYKFKSIQRVMQINGAQFTKSLGLTGKFRSVKSHAHLCICGFLFFYNIFFCQNRKLEYPYCKYPNWEILGSYRISASSPSFFYLITGNRCHFFSLSLNISLSYLASLPGKGMWLNLGVFISIPSEMQEWINNIT